MAALIIKLLKNSLFLNKIIGYMTHWHIFAILLKKEIILQFQFQGFFFKYIELFWIYLGWLP